MNLLTTDELAGKLKVSRTHLWRLRRLGMPFLKLEHCIRFSEPEVRSWINKNCVGGVCHE